MIAVFDACVLAKLFLAEDQSELAEEVVSKCKIIFIPDIAAIEVRSAITRSHRNGELSFDEASTELSNWRQFLRFSNVRLTPFPELIDKGEQLSLDLRHPLVDCLYVALAIREDLPLITADAPLIKSASVSVPQIRSLSSFAS